MTALDESFTLTVSLPVIFCLTSTSLLFSRVGNPFLTPVFLSEVSVFQVPSLGLHRQMKLLLHSCHCLGSGVLGVNVHWDVNSDGHECRIRSLMGMSSSEWHCQFVRIVGINRHTPRLLSP